MAGAALLTPGDVSVIRRYVRTKYAPMPAANQAEIIADAIVRTIRKRLPEWPEALRADVADRLVASCVVGEQREVYPTDVLRVCGDLALADEAHAISLLGWLNDWTDEAWTLDRIAERSEQGLILRSDSADMLISRATPIGSASSMDASRGNANLNVKCSMRADVVHTVTTANDSATPRTGWLAPTALRPLVLAAVTLLALAGILLASMQRSDRVAEAPPSDFIADGALMQPVPNQADESAPFAYSPFNAEAVRSYLADRDSLLVERPYFEAIVESARRHGIDPLLLFAVAGQEQGFVPKSAKKAKQIANNPFNVFNSWETYNTNISDSSSIAAKLLAKLAAGIPEGEEPFAWMNRTYAEDPRWSDGVRAIYDKLKSLGREQEQEKEQREAGIL
ncbi:hypothetical protein ACFSR7_21950 [Cohnella sp. GCM10020058]|uniref:hypothetical protein n=1 Tax=Cohnella sp. GCM10020058 TaxID=3317330 RepID=UPI00362A1C97